MIGNNNADNTKKQVGKKEKPRLLLSTANLTKDAKQYK